MLSPCVPTPCAATSSISGATSSPALGGKTVSRITRMDIQKLYTKLKHEGRVHDHPEYGTRAVGLQVLRIHAHAPPLSAGCGDRPCHPTESGRRCMVPKAVSKPRQILTREQMDAFLAAVEQNEVWRDFFYTELTHRPAPGARSAASCGRTSTRGPGH